MLKKIYCSFLFVLTFAMIFMQIQFYFLHYEYTKEVFDTLNIYKRLCILYGSLSLFYLYIYGNINKHILMFSLYLFVQQSIFFLFNELSIMINYLIPDNLFMAFQITIDTISLIIAYLATEEIEENVS